MDKQQDVSLDTLGMQADPAKNPRTAGKPQVGEQEGDNARSSVTPTTQEPSGLSQRPSPTHQPDPIQAA